MKRLSYYNASPEVLSEQDVERHLSALCIHRRSVEVVHLNPIHKKLCHSRSCGGLSSAEARRQTPYRLPRRSDLDTTEPHFSLCDVILQCKGWRGHCPTCPPFTEPLSRLRRCCNRGRRPDPPKKINCRERHGAGRSSHHRCMT